MKKINQEILSEKLLIQIAEAQRRGLTKLAMGVEHSLSTSEVDGDLNQMVYDGLWNVVGKIMNHHDVAGADIEKIDEILVKTSSNLIKEIEDILDLESNESEKLLGQK